MAIFDIITYKHPNFRWTQCVNVHLFIIVKHLSGGRVHAARPCGWPRVAGAPVGELVDPGPRQGGLHTAAVPGLNILYINVEEYSCIHAYPPRIRKAYTFWIFRNAIRTKE